MALNSDVHVWVINNDINVQNDCMEAAISLEEIKKSRTFVFEKDKVNFIRTRFFIRLAISHYLNIDIREVSFIYNGYSTLQINPYISNISLNFSISHSNEVIVFVFKQNQEIGVDIEYVEEGRIDDLIEDDSLFTTEEIKLLKSEQYHLRNRLFYKLWTCKESCIKASGIGSNTPLVQAEVSIDLNSASCKFLNRKIDDMPVLYKYHLVDIRYLPCEYVGTIALKSQNTTIKYVDKNLIGRLLSQFFY